MVWSEQVGVSLVVPSDRVNGDGRNYIVIGEDVPTEITDQFTAALVFRNGSPDTGTYGFNYWVIGINKFGALEVAGLMYQDVSSGQGIYQHYRQTILTASPPIGMDRPSTLYLGYAGQYGGSYNEKGVQVFGNVDNDTGWSAVGLAGGWAGGPIKFRVRNGVAYLSGGATFAGTWPANSLICGIPNSAYYPTDDIWGIAQWGTNLFPVKLQASNGGVYLPVSAAFGGAIIYFAYPYGVS